MLYGGCTTGFYPLNINFDKEEKIYQMGVNYYTALNQFILIFVSDKTMDNRPRLHLLSFNELMDNILTKKTMYIRYTSSCVNIDIEFPLAGAKEAYNTLQ